jgi:thiol:disulfide interchange protein DsbA
LQYATAAQPAAGPSPITDVTPYAQKDNATVIVFFKFGCPACRMMHPSLVSWGNTLPKGIAFEMYPVIEPSAGQKISAESILGLQTYWVANKIGAPSQQESFAADAYSLVQDENAGANRNRWFEALSSQGMKRQAIVAAWKSELSLLDARSARQSHYAPSSTPTMVVCGKWMISPDSTNGDPELFAQLANALVSQCADGLGIKVRQQ